MSTSNYIRAVTVFSALTLINFAASAENALGQLSQREGGFEVVLGSHYTNSTTFEGSGGSKVDIQDDWGWGFGFGYNMNENWAFNFDFGWNSFNYDATVGGADGKYNGTLDTSSTLFSATYNLMDKRFTPFISGVAGWLFLDTNIPDGPPGNTCWWDPWYGYICYSYVPTKSTTEFTYGGTLGLRFDVTNNMFLRAGYNMMWMDLDNLGTVDFDNFRLELGFLMN